VTLPSASTMRLQISLDAEHQRAALPVVAGFDAGGEAGGLDGQGTRGVDGRDGRGVGKVSADGGKGGRRRGVGRTPGATGGEAHVTAGPVERSRGRRRLEGRHVCRQGRRREQHRRSIPTSTCIFMRSPQSRDTCLPTPIATRRRGVWLLSAGHSGREFEPAAAAHSCGAASSRTTQPSSPGLAAG
jgi:hypothetical protein